MSFAKVVDAPCANRTLRKRFNNTRDPSPQGRSAIFDGPKQNSFRPGVRMSSARTYDTTSVVGGEGTTAESKARGGRAKTPTGRSETVHNPPFALEGSKAQPLTKGRRNLVCPMQDQGVLNTTPTSPDAQRQPLLSPMQKDSPFQRVKANTGKGSLSAGNVKRMSTVFETSPPTDQFTASTMQRFSQRPAVADHVGIQEQNLEAGKAGKVMHPPRASLTGILAPETRQFPVDQSYRPRAPWQK